MDKEITCFLVVGRMGKSLTVSKAEPFIIHPRIKKLYIFREKEASHLPKTIYIMLPAWILKIKPRILSKFIRWLAEPIQLIYYAIKIRPEIINGYHLIPKGINSLIAARLAGSKCIISLIGGTVEIDTYSRFKWILKRINLYALKKTDLITTKGNAVNTYLHAHNIPLSKVIIYNGAINLNKFFYDQTVTKEIDVLFVGTFRNLKGPDRVLQMVATLKNDFPDIKAFFIGEGYLLDFCREMSKRSGISDNVIFTGQIDDPSGFYKQSKVIVIPSRSEGLPTSMLEAMACGCVPVVSKVGNISDAAHHQENAFLVEDYLDIKSFTNYIHLLLSNNNLRQAMATNGVTYVRNNYSAQLQRDIIDRMIKKLY